MKLLIHFSALVLLTLLACKKEKTDPDPSPATADTTPPTIVLKGKSADTTYVQANYQDPGVTVTDNLDGDISASAVITGSVNTKTVGVYTLTYNAKDAAGNSAAAVTRTVLVYNQAQIFAGNYNVASSYTAVIADPSFPTPTVTTGNYTSIITVNNGINTFFNVNPLRVGPADMPANGYYDGSNGLSLNYNSQLYANGGTTVTLAPSKTTFTVFSTTYDVMYPSRTFYCQNIFVKQ